MFAGNSVMESTRWMLSVEYEVVMSGSGFVSGLSALFAAYYVLNLQYESGAGCTLEFIQRLVALF
jgi:hypothetical protein